MANRACRGRHIVHIIAAVVLLVAPVRVAAARLPVVVLDDHGGALAERVALVETYRKSSRQLEIRGQVCLSSCTLYLRLRNVCVTPDTAFGFHGPSSGNYGIGLPPDSFEHWSHVMARHYPQPIRGWFLDTARHRTVGFHYVSGQQLIDLGVSACD